MRAANTLAMAGVVLLISSFNLAHGSPPPFPEEMKYPNVVAPSSQFGTYGTRLGEFNNPMGVSYSPDGDIYIADTYNNRIQVLTPGGRPLRTFGTRGRGKGQLTNPHAVAVHQDGSVYVADTGNDRVVVYDAAGKVVRTWGKFGGQRSEFREPYGLAVDKHRVYVVDRGNQRVQIFDLQGNFLLAVGEYGQSAGQFDRPADITVDDIGNFYVADAYNDRIQKFDAAGAPLTQWGQWGSYSGLMATPSSVAHRQGRIYIADLINHRVQVFSTSGEYQFQWGRHPVVPHEGGGRLHYPSRIAVNADGQNAIVCEPFEHRCQVFSGSIQTRVANVDDSAWWNKATRFHYGARAKVRRNILTIAEPDTHAVLVFDISEHLSEPTLIASLGGQGREVGRFVRPSGMLIENDGALIHVSDGGNHRIQSFELQRSAASTLAFTPNSARVVRSMSVISLGVRPSSEPFIPFNALATPPGIPTAPVEPSAMERDKEGLLYLVDPHNSRVMVLDRGNKLVRVIGKYGTGSGEFLVPSDIAFSKDGETIYIVDTYNFRIQAFDRKTAAFKFAWGGPGIGKGHFVHPFAITAGKDGHVYVSDDGANRIQKFDEAGRFVSMWGRWGSEPGQFYKPKGITQSDSLDIYVMDFGNHRGQVFSNTGEFRRLFGIPVAYTAPIAMRSNKSPLEVSNGGTYSVRYASAPDQIPLSHPFELAVSVVRTDGQPLSPSAQLAVSANMPAHYHGMNTKAVAEKRPDGSWVVKGMLFHMPGYWKINYDIREGDTTERAEADVMLK